jgi:hypothetical protein
LRPGISKRALKNGVERGCWSILKPQFNGGYRGTNIPNIAMMVRVDPAFLALTSRDQLKAATEASMDMFLNAW